jgi:hypothetical protein
MNVLRSLTWRIASDFIFPNYRKSHNIFKAMMTLMSPDELRSMCDNVVCTVLPKEQDVIDVKTVLGEEFTQFVRKHNKTTVAVTSVFYDGFMPSSLAKTYNPNHRQPRPYPNSLQPIEKEVLGNVLRLYDTIMNLAEAYITAHPEIGSTLSRKRLKKEVVKLKKALVALRQA